MDRVLQIVGRTAGEVLTLRYPRGLLNFCDFDLAYFAESAIKICDESMKAGELDFDRVTDLRNSLKSAHMYIENNIRTTYDKIVLDCWIDYVCRRDNVGTGTLWNRFMPCNTAFEKAVFVRLCDYRYKRAINEWLNLVRIQDYAKHKVNFIFSPDVKSVEEASARKNYFDLMFSVTARELGCRLEDLGVTKVFSAGRLPAAPFMYPNISKDIVKNLLSDFDYSEDYSDTDSYGGIADQIAMDAFSYMKAGIAAEYNSYNISRSEMQNAEQKVYMPCGMKAVCDLEIDALIESGGWLARCKKCGRYYVRDEEYPHEYCSLFNPGGKTCLEIYEIENPRSLISPQLERRYREITDEMYSRVDETMTLKEYESWKIYLDALHGKVENGEIPAEELESFIGYSSSLDISRSNPVREVPKREAEPVRERERVVKPFVPERIDRSELMSPPPQKLTFEEEYTEPVSRSKSFFTSPTVERQKSKDSSVTRIIRAEQQTEPRQSGGFTPFGQTEPLPNTAPKQPSGERYAFSSFDRPQEQPAAYKEPSFPNFAEQTEIRREPTFTGFTEQNIPYSEPTAPMPSENSQPAEPEIDIGRVTEMLMGLREIEQKRQSELSAEQPSGFELFGDISYDSGDSLEMGGSMFDAAEPANSFELPQLAPEPPKPKIIRKNAAAISAYGKISGAPVMTAAEASEPAVPVAVPSAPAEPAPVIADPEPFRDVGSIFDVLERSGGEGESYFAFDRKPAEQAPVTSSEPAAKPIEPAPAPIYERESVPMAEPAPKPELRSFEETSYEPLPEAPQKPKRKPAKKSRPEPAPEWEREIPDKVTEENAPSGIWTEERNLFPENQAEQELAMLKEKKRTRSSKTRRLYDAIMKEPEDNPNVRRKKY